MANEKALGELKSQRALEEAELKRIEAELKRLEEKKNELSTRVETLKEKQSLLAKSLLPKAETELSNVEVVYSTLLLKRNVILANLEDIKENIYNAEDDTSLYIEQQVPNMVFEFCEYVKENFEEIGSRLKVVYNIWQDREYYCEGRFDVCTVPNGIVGICDKDTQDVITSTKDFCFKAKLFNPKRIEYTGEMYCEYTEWYITFLKKFMSRFFEVLEEEFPFKDTFKLNFEETYFTIELL